jgi:hypothetical protein
MPNKRVTKMVANMKKQTALSLVLALEKAVFDGFGSAYRISQLP